MVRLTKKESQQQDKVELLLSTNQVNQESTTQATENSSYLCSEDNDTNKLYLTELLKSVTPSKKINYEHLTSEKIFERKLKNKEPVKLGNKEEVNTLIDNCSNIKNPDAQELASLLQNPHFQQLIDCHDNIGENIKKSEKFEGHLIPVEVLNGNMPIETIKMVGIRRNPNQPLGFTIEVDEYNQVVVARIVAGGIIEKQSLLHPGDVILEVNGVPVHTAEELQTEVSRSKEHLTFKVGPNVEDEIKSGRLTAVSNGAFNKLEQKLTCYMRALFSYNPEDDSLIPCPELGLAFNQGDILQIIDVKDPNWWQARNITSNSDKTGLIPSQELEERRKAFVPPEADFVHKIGICGTRISKRKRKTMYKSIANCEFDKADLMLYEEVTRMPPFRRKTLVLIGVTGVGRRTLKNRLINSDPDKFGAVIPHTTRPKRPLEEDGTSYWFVDREEMEEEIKNNKFLEYGEHNGNLYGTHIESIKDVIKSGKMCILDCAPNSLKILHNSTELMPFVIFVAAPGMEQLKQIYAERRATSGSQRSLAFDRQSSIRYSSRRARTLESLASLYEDDDLVSTVEESAFLQRKYEKYFDMVLVNDDFDETFRKVVEALDQLSHDHQWVPVNWIY
ncbi:protein PALS2 [Condylostylus longicornis]|uniref:protein PALS2 n=1 Tax=Condylostylus longicornis TaxID=2530218 RepID=UPI00244E1688|nr:protein PALS2 [Condylostylus longicornis]